MKALKASKRQKRQHGSQINIFLLLNLFNFNTHSTLLQYQHALCVHMNYKMS